MRSMTSIFSYSYIINQRNRSSNYCDILTCTKSKVINKSGQFEITAFIAFNLIYQVWQIKERSVLRILWLLLVVGCVKEINYVHLAHYECSQNKHVKRRKAKLKSNQQERNRKWNRNRNKLCVTTVSIKYSSAKCCVSSARRSISTEPLKMLRQTSPICRSIISLYLLLLQRNRPPLLSVRRHHCTTQDQWWLMDAIFNRLQKKEEILNSTVYTYITYFIFFTSYLRYL